MASASPDPWLGVVLHALGGLGAGSFYLPLTRVRQWSWESYWLVGGLAFWLVCPWLVAVATVPGLFSEVLEPGRPMAWAVLLGFGWGLGNLAFGLSLRYLGIALGTALSLGWCALVGTLAPPLVAGTLPALLATAPGRATLFGVAVCLGGIALCGLAGVSKERELSPAGKPAAVREFALVKGAIVALAAGILSACFAFGVAAAEPIAERASLRAGHVWKNGPSVALILTGGALANIAWCVALNVRNQSGGEYRDRSLPLVRNYLLCLAAGVIAYTEFLSFGMGETQMGEYGFASWSIHLAFVIVFSNLWGLALKEWDGTSPRTRALVFGGLAVLVVSAAIMGYGSYLKRQELLAGARELRRPAAIEKRKGKDPKSHCVGWLAFIDMNLGVPPQLLTGSPARTRGPMGDPSWAVEGSGTARRRRRA